VEPTLRDHSARLPTKSHYAFLEADGDGVGTLLREARGTARESIVAALYRFADDACKRIEARDGCAFYVGGDEVAAYLPVDRALETATALATLFEETMREVAMDPERRGTLSIGIVIAHLKDDLRATRRRGRGALQEAKRQKKRDGKRASSGWLSVQEEPRGGAARVAVHRLLDGAGSDEEGLPTRIARWRNGLASGAISMKLAHDLLELAERFEAPPPDDRTGLHVAKRAVKSKHERNPTALTDRDQDETQAIRACIETRIETCATWREARQLAHEVLLAERMQRAAAQRAPAPVCGTEQPAGAQGIAESEGGR
jgi:CRISPR-associated protein Cmr2